MAKVVDEGRLNWDDKLDTVLMGYIVHSIAAGIHKAVATQHAVSGANEAVMTKMIQKVSFKVVN